MATTIVARVIGATAASGAAGYVLGLSLQNTAVAAAIATAQGLTGIGPNITVTDGGVVFDGLIFEFFATLHYITVT